MPDQLPENQRPIPAETFAARLAELREALPQRIRGAALALADEPGTGGQARWFPSPADSWLPEATLGHGFFADSYPVISKSSESPFVKLAPGPELSNGTALRNATVKYLKDEEEAREFSNSSSGIDLGFSIGGFSLGFDFSSSHMSQSRTASTTAYYVVAYADMQSIEFRPGQDDFTEDARAAWESTDRLEFLNRFGTHFINETRLGASLKIIFTLSASTRADLDGFADSAGLSLGYAGFNVGLKGKVEEASGKYQNSIRIDAQTFITGAAGFSLSKIISLDFDELQQIAQDFTTAVGANRDGIKTTAFKIRPYGELFGTTNAVVNQAVGDALFALRDMSESDSDMQRFLRYPGFYRTQVTSAEVLEVRRRKAAMIKAFDGMFLEVGDSSPQRVEELYFSWIDYVQSLDWPIFANQVMISFKGFVAGATQIVPVLTIKRSGNYIIDSLTKCVQSAVPTPGAPDASFSNTPLQQTVAPVVTDDTVTLEFEPVSLAEPDGKMMHLDATDSLGHLYRYLIILRVGGVRADLSEVPRGMITIH